MRKVDHSLIRHRPSNTQSGLSIKVIQHSRPYRVVVPQQFAIRQYHWRRRRCLSLIIESLDAHGVPVL